MSEVETLVNALRTLQERHVVASRDEALMNRLRALYTVLGNVDDSDNAVIIRALFQMAGMHRETLAAVGQTKRRQTDVLARRVRELSDAGLSASQIAAKLDRTTSSVYRLRARAKR